MGGFLPARMDAEQTAAVLGFQEHDIPVLVAEGRLEPLGKPLQNARKYFARAHILEVADNPQWLAKATNVVYQFWIKKNAGRGRGEQLNEVKVQLNRN